MAFEARLRRTLGSILGIAAIGNGVTACAGGDGDDGPDLSKMCSGGAAPANHQLDFGFVQVEPGSPCPEPADAVLEVNGCTFLEWQDVTCDLDHVDPNQVFVDDGYGGHFANATTAATGTYVDPEAVDVCWYEAVFYLPPDHPICGRPLLDEGRPVLAEVHPGNARWAAGPRPVVSDLSAADRRQLGAWWLQSALLEHASVASFSQFSLELLRFGAPPDLVRAAHQAALDEITHAEACFSLANAYLGKPVGPGAIGSTGFPPPAASLARFAEALVREGCVGETLAAVDAAARLAVARDPAVRATLTAILRDESAHAALAWRALAWILERDGDGAIRARLEIVFAEERQRWTSVAEVDAVSASAQEHGLLPGPVRAHALRRAWEEVIGASWATLRCTSGAPSLS